MRVIFALGSVLGLIFAYLALHVIEGFFQVLGFVILAAFSVYVPFRYLERAESKPIEDTSIEDISGKGVLGGLGSLFTRHKV